jgi:CheY-like chemotaxis protein
MTKPTILLVEDDPDHLELTLDTLLENGADHEIIVATNGAEALEYLFCEGKYINRSPDDMPELILLDLCLPGMSGMQVMNRMRDDPRTFFVPIVMLTLTSEDSQVVQAYKGGLNSYASKPLQYREFQEKLEQVRQYWRRSDFSPLTH